MPSQQDGLFHKTILRCRIHQKNQDVLRCRRMQKKKKQQAVKKTW